MRTYFPFSYALCCMFCSIISNAHCSRYPPQTHTHTSKTWKKLQLEKMKKEKKRRDERTLNGSVSGVHAIRMAHAKMGEDIQPPTNQRLMQNRTHAKIKMRFFLWCFGCCCCCVQLLVVHLYSSSGISLWKDIREYITTALPQKDDCGCRRAG